MADLSDERIDEIADAFLYGAPLIGPTASVRRFARAIRAEGSAAPDSTCRYCNGAGTQREYDGAGPDAHPVDVECSHCGGTGAVVEPPEPVAWQFDLDDSAAELLKNAIGSDDTVSPVSLALMHSPDGYGLHVWLTEYPEEGSILLVERPAPSSLTPDPDELGQILQDDLTERAGKKPEAADEDCRKCGGEMRPGKALAQTYGGVPDFIGGECVTMSAGGPGRLIDCLKCARCGWSVTPTASGISADARSDDKNEGLQRAADEDRAEPPPEPTCFDLASPAFNAIWNVIKHWDVNAPWYSGYCGATTGTHVKAILVAIAETQRSSHTAVSDEKEAPAVHESALREALTELCDALDATNWSSWQTTARFWPAFEAARRALAEHPPEVELP